MTEPKTVDEIIALGREYGKCVYICGAQPSITHDTIANAALGRFEAAITALAAERDQAVKLLGDVDRVVVGNLVKERNALKAQLKESQEFVKTLRADVTRLNSEDMRF